MLLDDGIGSGHDGQFLTADDRTPAELRAIIERAGLRAASFARLESDSAPRPRSSADRAAAF